MTLDDWRSGGTAADYRGYDIFLRRGGRGRPLLCIHGFPTASWDWHALWPELTARFDVLAPDLIGFGFSAKPRPYGYSILDQADLCEALIREAGWSELDVLAHDYGDTVAQELLARDEERRRSHEPGPRLRSVCFLNGGLFPECHRARRVQKLLLGPFGGLLSRLTTETAFSRSLAAVFAPSSQPSAAELHDFWRLTAHNDGAAIAHHLIHYMSERIRYRQRWVGTLQSSPVRLRLINGAADPVSGEHMAQRYEELVPGPDVVLLANVGHYPQLEDPAAVLAAFLSFTSE